MVVRFFKRRIYTIKRQNKDVDDFVLTRRRINKIKNIFFNIFLYYVRGNKVLYELLYNRENKLEIKVIQYIYKFFWDYFLYKFYNTHYNLNPLQQKRKRKLKKKKIGKILKKLNFYDKRLKIKNKRKFKKNHKSAQNYKNKKIRKFHKFKKNFKYKFLNKSKLIKKEDVLKSRVVRYLKMKIEERIPFTRNIINFKNLILQNATTYDNFGIKPKKKIKIKKNTQMFLKLTNILCHKFFNNLIQNFYKKNHFVEYSIKNQKFLNRIFNFCLYQDQFIKKNRRYILDADFEKGDELKKEEFLEQVDNIQFCSGLTVKITLKRRNCFFHIWDNNSGFTLARVSGGFFGYYYKKIYRKYRQFAAFIQFFKRYFQSIIISYKQKIFSRFRYLRKIYVKNLKSKKIFKLLKTKSNIKVTNYHLKLNIVMEKNLRQKLSHFHASIFNIINRIDESFDYLKYIKSLVKNLEKQLKIYKDQYTTFENKKKIKMRLLEDLKKKKNLIYGKKKLQKNLRFSGLSFLFFFRNKLNITYIIQMRKSFYQAKSMFNFNWSNLMQTLRLVTQHYKVSTNIKQVLFSRIFNSIKILKMYKNIKYKRFKYFLFRNTWKNKNYKKYKIRFFKYLKHKIRCNFKIINIFQRKKSFQIFNIMRKEKNKKRHG